jgi:hypothetical protein
LQVDAAAETLAPAETGPERRRRSKLSSSKHGLTTLRRAVNVLGNRVISRRFKLGRALWQWRSELIDDLGGQEVVSTQQVAVIDLAVKTKLLLDSVDAWLLIQPSLVNARRRALLPVVLQRQQLADGLARYLAQLGLERRAKKVADLKDYLAEQYGNANRKKALDHRVTFPGADTPVTGSPAARASTETGPQ